MRKSLQVVKEHSEQAMIDALGSNSISAVKRSVLLCSFSKVPEYFLGEGVIAPLLKEKNATMFYCHDGDIFVCWDGDSESIKNTLQQEISKKLGEKSSQPNFFKLYDFKADSAAVHIECVKKQGRIIDGDLSAVQKQELIQNICKRSSRPCLEMLILEDDRTSRMFLTSMLNKQYKCHEAGNANEAIDLYIKNACDVVFLDVELPGMNGHDVAKLIRKYDPDSYIVMVTGNNRRSDVEKAKQNNVQAFIVKPFSQNKINVVINGFLNNK